jgi:23S rRNA pseudouridine1911/1915/1917 synthase
MMAALTILHEDDSLIAVAKPAGIATANVPAGEESVFTLVRSLIARKSRQKPPSAGPGAAARAAGGGPFLGVVSRLDKPVSGVVVLAKTRAAAASLAAQFRESSIEKTYHAIVEGRFPAAVGQWVTWRDLIERPEDARERGADRGRSRASTARPAEGDDDGSDRGRPADLRARVLKRFGEVSIVELRPLTGRRHQLRAQCAAHGCPIVGDRMYGARLPFPAGVALHAREIAFGHPATGRPCRIMAEFPEAWRPRFAPLIAAIAAMRG